jgi:hypothetical protein
MLLLMLLLLLRARYTCRSPIATPPLPAAFSGPPFTGPHHVPR